MIPSPRGGGLGRGGLFLCLILLLPATASAQSATDTFSVEGNILNGTGGGTPPAEAAVNVVAFHGDASAGSWDGQGDDAGHYRIDGIARIPDATYAIGADYEGVSYVDRLEADASSDLTTADITVYESVPRDPGIRFERSAWIISGVDPDQQTVQMLEVYGLTNPTDRSFVPGAGGPTGLLVFPLPAHATNLQAHLGLDPSTIAQIDLGFASLDPVRPGQTEIAFSYQFPYGEGSYELSRTIRYPTDSLHFLVAQPGPALQGEGWQDDGFVTVGGIRYQELETSSFDANTRIVVTIGGLPLRPPGLPTPPPSVLASVGIAAGLAVILVAYRRRSRAEPISDEEPDLDRSEAPGR